MGVLDGWGICPRCGHELERPPGRAHCPGCGSMYYANSAPAVEGLLERGGRVLLAKRRVDPREGFWDLPGGFLEEGEEPLDGLRREFREETGLEVEPVDFLGVWTDRYGGDSTAEATLNLYWTARVTGGEPAPADDVDDLRWFNRHELPPAGELAFVNVPLVLAAWQLHAQRTRLDR